MITTAHYLVLSVALLLIGTVGILLRRNAVVVLMSLEKSDRSHVVL